LHAHFCLEFGFSKHGPAMSGKGGFRPQLDAYDLCALIMTLKSKIHPTPGSAAFHIFHYNSERKMPGKYFDVFT
jgi:hypothetical protein